MKTILIFDVEVSGHHLEYIHHLHCLASQSKDKFIFCLPNEFIKVKAQFEWEQSDNIVFDLFNYNNQSTSYSSILNSSYKKCKILKKYTKKYNPSNIFLISLMHFLPFLPFILSPKTKVSGIIYQIYLYRWKSSKFTTKCSDIIKYILLTFANCIQKVYILNDRPASIILNRIYHTHKYTFIPDPFIPVKINPIEIINRQSLEIDKYKIIFLHMGDMRKRKGTLEILDSISYINTNLQSKLCFIFAGKISDEIKDSFYKKCAQISKNIQIIVFDQFCDYRFLASLCSLSDYMLIPYKFVNQSSGIIGYSAQFQLPVIGPKEGLIGKLIKRYKLGYTIPNINHLSIAEFLNNNPLSNNRKDISNKYLTDNNVESFLSSIQFD